MIRTALQPKWLGALVLAIAFAVACVFLGNWQFREAQAETRGQEIDHAASLPVQPLTEVVAPQSAFPREGSTRRVTASGRYAPEHQILIADRRLNDVGGYWVVTPLIVDETDAALPVLRGFITDPADAPQPPAGPVTVAGGLAPGESPSSQGGLPDGVYRSIDMSLLVNAWDVSVYNAFLFATDETVAGVPAALDGLERVPPPTGESSELNLKNAMYAVQWWIFAAFGFFLWWRMVRQAHREEIEETGAPHTEREPGPTEPEPAIDPTQQKEQV